MSDVSERVELLKCPFCGASPLKGETKRNYGQDGDPLQGYKIWCPHSCAQFERPSKELAIAAWNLRSSTLAADRVVDDAMWQRKAEALVGTIWWDQDDIRSETSLTDAWQSITEINAKEIIEFARSYALRAVQPSIAGEAIPRSEWGCELWEILFGLLKGAVPDELTDEVLQRLAEDFMSALSSKDNGDGNA